MNDPTVENTALAGLLREHGIDIEPDEEWIGLPGGMRARSFAWFPGSAHAGIEMVQLDVVVELWTGRWVVESCAGFGASRAEAVEVAMQAFAQTALPPMLVAFLHTDEDVVRDAWEINGEMRAITIGQVGVRGEVSGDGLELGWFRAFERELRRASLPGGTHWVRIYRAQQQGEEVAMEVLLDNEPWGWMTSRLAGSGWPSGSAFSSVRLFVVIQGGLDVSRAVARMAAMPNRPDAEIGEALASDGADAREVQALLAYVPLAFGRMALRELPVTFSETAMVKEQEGDEGVEVRLAEESVFSQASELARRAVEQGTMTQEQFLVVAARSAEVHAINQAVIGGAEPKDLVVSAPVVRLYERVTRT